MAKRLSDTEIQIRIVPKHLRWPAANAGPVWYRLHECVKQLHSFVRAVDNNCDEIETKADLGRDGIDRDRAEFGYQALRELANFKPLNIAKQAATREIGLLQKSGESLTSEQVHFKQILTKAVEELRAGVSATERLVLERCKLREKALARFR